MFKIYGVSELENYADIVDAKDANVPLGDQIQNFMWDHLYLQQHKALIK